MQCVSLFSGCGGLDLGLTQAGFNIVLAVDNDQNCAISHKKNFPTTSFFEGSVSELDLELMKKLTNNSISKGVDLLAGGPPCPPFSKSRFYRKNKPRALEDEIGRITITGYLKTLELLKPKAFIMENVPGFAFKVHNEALQSIVSKAEELGYICNWEIINAADYGVPQMRERFFLVGMLGNKFAFPTPTHGKKELTTVKKLKPWRTTGEVLNDLDTEANADDTGHFAGGKHHDLLKKVPPGDNYLFFTAKRNHPKPIFKWRSRYWSFLLKLSPELPSWTIQARRSNNMGPFHWRNRILRIAEIKRLQTFPDHFQLSGKIEQQWRQIGNAVPPLLAYQLGIALKQQLNNCKLSEERIVISSKKKIKQREMVEAT